jgi:hypothetical protein
MPDAPRERALLDDLAAGRRVGRFNRLKEHVSFRAFRAGSRPPLGRILYFDRADAAALDVDLAGAKVILARGPCLPPREELDDYRSMPPLAPILLSNMLQAHGVKTEIRDLLGSHRPTSAASPASHRQPLGRDAWTRALEGQPSPPVARLLDQLVEDIRPAGADAVGLSMETGGDFLLALCLAQQIHQRFSIPTLIGGRGVQLPEPLLRSCPAAVVVHDEGEIPLLLCLDALLHQRDLGAVPSVAYARDGEVHSTQAMIHDLDVRPTFDLSGAPLTGYRGRLEVEGSGPVVPYQYSIGCPFSCGFCNATSRRVYRLRSPHRIVEDLEHVVHRYGVRRFHMLSHLLNADTRHLAELIGRLEAADLGIYWSDCCRPAGIDADTLRRLRRVGASILVWGVDCGSERLSRIMRKGVNHDEALHILAASHRAGIHNFVNIIVGMPHETERDVEETLRFIDRAKPYVHKFETPTYLFHPESLLARNPERYGLLPGSDGGVDEPGGLTWHERLAKMPSVARRVARHDPTLRGYDLRGPVARALTGPALSPLWRRWRAVGRRIATGGRRAR